MAKPRPIRLKDAPFLCEQERIAMWLAMDDAMSDAFRVPYGFVPVDRHKWRLPYDHRRAY